MVNPTVFTTGKIGGISPGKHTNNRAADFGIIRMPGETNPEFILMCQTPRGNRYTPVNRALHVIITASPLYKF